MKKTVGCILGLLAINVAVTFGAAAAFSLFIFRGDPILAAVPAVLAAPAILLQPWFVAFFFFIPSASIYTPLLTTVVTVFVYGLLNRLGMLERPKAVLARFKNRKAFAVAGGFVLLAIVVAFARHVDFPPLHREAPPYVTVSGLNVTDSRYYCLYSFIDSAWLWRARVQEADLDSFKNKFGLRPVGDNQVPDAFRQMPPYWWQPLLTDRTQVLSTPDFPAENRGPDGWHALATWSPDDQTLYMWIKNNF